MRSLLIEFHRFKNLDTGSLREGDDYLVAAAQRPVREIRMAIDQLPFIQCMQALRYTQGPAERAQALQRLGGLVTDMLGVPDMQELQAGAFPLQLDLVVNAAELAALPFEAASDRDGNPLLVRQQKPVELTRRVRHDFAEFSADWPAKPRVLYAWAAPPEVGEVPYAAHEQELRNALEPWIPITDNATDTGGVLTVLPEASLHSLTEVCRAAARAPAGERFSHVHILAHGYPVGRGLEETFGIALHSRDNPSLDAVTPDEIQAALAPLAELPVIVTLATCDAANEANPINPRRSIAHELHVAGFPVVVASQLPFTVPGSSILIRHFYHAVLRGEDVRLALHQARAALYSSREKTGHDWLSLVGYVRLPEGYAEHLLDVALASTLASLKTMQNWADELVKRGEADAARFDHVAALLRERIEQLEEALPLARSRGRAELLAEHVGLLGSAEKRYAELCFARAALGDTDAWTRRMRRALEGSRHWYRQGFDDNQSSHWNGVQYLSLEAVLQGQIDDRGAWFSCVRSAQIARRSPDEYWAHGSLAELYLLAPLAGQPQQLEPAEAVLKEMQQRVAELAPGNPFPLETTARQLRRYTQWWTEGKGFFGSGPDLAAEARRLLAVLDR